MNTMLLVSYFALWAVVLLLIFAFAVVVRQIGLLHQRLAPTGARMTSAGPQIGELITARAATDLSGRPVELGGAGLNPTLLLFMSAACTACGDVAPALRALWKRERRRISFAIVSVGGSEEDNRDFVARYRLEDIPFVLSPPMGIEYKVLSPPYGVFLDDAGVVKAKGIVNSFEHLESLLNAAELNEPTMETFMAKRIADSSLDPMFGTSK